MQRIRVRWPVMAMRNMDAGIGRIPVHHWVPVGGSQNSKVKNEMGPALFAFWFPEELFADPADHVGVGLHSKLLRTFRLGAQANPLQHWHGDVPSLTEIIDQ